MRTFERPNFSFGFKCPVCGTSADKPVTLAPIPGTEDGGNIEAMQVHAECAELVARMQDSEARA